MVFFITVLRALAAMIITNSHYTGVYPSDIIANGGLFGDVIFFAVSGFCLFNIKQKFDEWYLKRVFRCYTAPVIITGVYMLIGLYDTPTGILDALRWFIYPTNYHFVASIILLYIPYYFVVKTDKLRNNIPLIMLGIALVYTFIYILFYDKSYYHIDKVREPMIRFLFFEAMMLGAYFRINVETYRNKIKITDWIMLVGSFVLYFASKLVFTNAEVLSGLQIVNQIILILLLYYTLKCFCGIDSVLEKLPKGIKRILEYLAEITLEIYVVQYAIIPLLAKTAPFPINWVLITGTILIVASLLRFAVRFVDGKTDKLLKKRGQE